MIQEDDIDQNIFKQINKKAQEVKGEESEIESIVSAIKLIDKNIKMYEKQLQDKIIELGKIPEKFHNIMNEVVIKISNEAINRLQAKLSIELNKSINSYVDNVKNLEVSVKDTIDKLDDYQNGRLRKAFLTNFCIIIFSVAISACMTFFMMKKFPTKVDLITTKEVNVENSEVFLYNGKAKGNVSKSTNKFK